MDYYNIIVVNTILFCPYMAIPRYGLNIEGSPYVAIKPRYRLDIDDMAVETCIRSALPRDLQDPTHYVAARAVFGYVRAGAGDQTD